MELGQVMAQIKHDDIAKLFGMSLNVAAQRVGLSRTAFKKVCRREGIDRWPSPHSLQRAPKPSKLPDGIPSWNEFQKMPRFRGVSQASGT